uniref:Secretogranin-3 n=1 Tax=Cynoglossus semilaevis TaxID=244447 RepID=A0A3P8W233_CYNSE
MTNHGHLLVLVQLLTLTVISHISAFPTPRAPAEDKTMSIRDLTEEKPLQEQIAEADSVKAAIQAAESSRTAAAKDAAPRQDSDDLTVLKSLADSQKSKQTTGKQSEEEDQYIPDESDSTKTRRLAEDYDSTKNGVTSDKYQDDPESFHQVDGTPLTAEDIVQKIANKIYKEDDRGVFDRIISKLLKLGLITESQADTLEYQVAEALQDLITKNAKKNEIEDEEDDDQETRGDEEEQDSDDNLDTWELPKRRYNDEDDDEADEDDDEREDEVDRDVEDDGTDGADNSWDRENEEANEVNPDDGLQDLQYFPNFYRLLKSLDSAQDTQEKETLITIMKTLIDFVKMMVKYGTITPEEGVSYLENLDAVIAIQTKNKLGKSLDPDLPGPHGKMVPHFLSVQFRQSSERENKNAVVTSSLDLCLLRTTCHVVPPPHTLRNPYDTDFDDRPWS